MIAFGSVIALLVKPFTRPLEMKAHEAAASLKGIIDGSGGEWAFDDFTSIEIADPRLEAIRRRALQIQEPFDDQGMAILCELLAEAEGLAAGG